VVVQDTSGLVLKEQYGNQYFNAALAKCYVVVFSVGHMHGYGPVLCASWMMHLRFYPFAEKILSRSVVCDAGAMLF
jgi:hypothetical protein